jgi:hypothetical protein
MTRRVIVVFCIQAIYLELGSQTLNVLESENYLSQSMLNMSRGCS